MNSKEFRTLQESYLAVYDNDIREKLEFESWVNNLLEEGYDLSNYTWDEMYEHYIQLDEGRRTSLSALSHESEQRKADKKRGRPEAEVERDSRLMRGRFRPGASQDERAEGGREVLKVRNKVPKKGGKDMFEHILEHLVAEGYADTNEAALAIMANMSDNWKESIVESMDPDSPGNTHSLADAHRANDKVKELKKKHGDNWEKFVPRTKVKGV
jgi:hypothetical protein